MTIDYDKIENNFVENLEAIYSYYVSLKEIKNIENHLWEADKIDSIKNAFLIDFTNRLSIIRQIAGNVDENEKSISESISSIHTLNRALLENYLIYRHIFFETSKSVELANLRYKLYIRDGLLTRQKFPTNIQEAKLIHSIEKAKIQYLENEIDLHLVNLNLIDDRAKLLRRWKPDYKDMIETSNFGKTWKDTIYKFLSGHSHSLYSGLIQTIENERKYDGLRLLENCIQYTMVISCHFMNELLTIPLLINVKLEEDREAIFKFYYQLGSQ